MVETEKRGALLTSWLILMLVSNGITAVSYLLYLLGGRFISSVPPAIPVWAIYSLGVFALLNLVFTILLFMWKKWAFFAFCGTAGIAFVVNLVTGMGIVSLLGLTGPVILYLIMKSKWDLFE